MRLDDGRYIVESKGRVPFRIVDILKTSAAYSDFIW
jgi:Lon protease-like protein